MKKKSLKKLNLQVTTIAKVHILKINGGRPSDTTFTNDTCFCDAETLCCG